MNRNFKWLWGAQATSAFGSRLTRTALPIVAILTIDASPFELGVLGALSVGPGAAVGLLAGGAIDRSRKRRILIATDLFRLALLLSVPLAAWTGLLSIAQLFAVAALAGIATTLFQITDNTYLPVLVSDDDLVEANSKLEATEAAAEITGPGVAGVLIDLITAPLTILIDALTYAASALMLFRIDAEEPFEPTSEKFSLRRDVASGAAAVWRVRLIRYVFLADAANAFFSGFFFALYMIFTLKVLALSPSQVGWVISVGGVGALFGAALAARISPTRRAARVLFAVLAMSLFADLLIPLAQGPKYVVITILVAHQFVSDGFGVAYRVLSVSLRQRLVRRSELGRANAFFQVAESALLPVGALLGGGLASVVGIRAGVWIGVGGGLTAVLFLVPVLNEAITVSGARRD